MAIDDTLFRRRSKTWATSWLHDRSAPELAKTGYSNNWVIAAIVVKLSAVRRPLAIPALAKLVIKNRSSASRLWLARHMTGLSVGALPGRDIHVVADSAYAGGELKKLPPRVTWTTRLCKDAALYGLPPQRTGKRGRPRQKGDRLPALAELAAPRRVHRGHRYPLRQDRRHQRRRGHLPAALGLRQQGRHRRC